MFDDFFPDLETVESGVEGSPAAVRSVAANITPVSVVEADSTNAASTSEKSSAEVTGTKRLTCG